MGFGAFGDVEVEDDPAAAAGGSAAGGSSLGANSTPFSPAAAAVPAVIAPGAADAPTDDPLARTDASVTLAFSVPADTTKVSIQALSTSAAAAAKKGTDPWAGAVAKSVPGAASAAKSFVFEGLPANTEFLFRLLCENSAGKTPGKPSIAIGTLGACGLCVVVCVVGVDRRR